MAASISDFLLDLVDEEADIFPGYRGLRDISTLEVPPVMLPSPPITIIITNIIIIIIIATIIFTLEVPPPIHTHPTHRYYYYHYHYLHTGYSHPPPPTIIIAITPSTFSLPALPSFTYLSPLVSVSHTLLTDQSIAEGLAKVQSPPFRARPGSGAGGGGGGAGGGAGGGRLPGSGGGVVRSEYDERGVGRDEERGGGGGRARSSSDDRGPGLGPGLSASEPGLGLRPGLVPGLSASGPGLGLSAPGQGLVPGPRLGLAGTMWGSPSYSYSGAPRSSSGSGGGYGSSSGSSSSGGGTGSSNSSSGSSGNDDGFLSSLIHRLHEVWSGPGTRASSSSSEGFGRPGFSVVGVGEWTSRQLQQRFRTW